MGITLHIVQPGDEIYRILKEHYGNKVFLSDQAALVARLQKNNKHIPDINLIYPGQVVALPDIPTGQNDVPPLGLDVCHALSAICTEIKHLEPAARNMLPVFDGYQAFSTAGEGFLTVTKGATKAALSDVRNVGLSYFQMKAGTISRGQYNYRRQVSLKRADHKLGPLRMGLTPGKTARQAVRIRPRDAIRTSAILHELKTLNRVVKNASRGAVVVNVAQLGSKSAEIHFANNNQERTVILVDAVSGTVGSFAGAAIAVALVGTPIGWLAIAGIVGASAVGGYAGEAFGKAIIEQALYDEDGNRLNTAADRIWESFYAK